MPAKNHLYRWVVVSLVAVTIIGALFYPLKVLLLTDVKRNTGLIIPIRNQAGFTIEYTHSVNKTKVQEHFVFAPENCFVLTSSTFQSLGVGTPFLPEEGKLVNDNGVFLLSDINRDFESITIGFMPMAKQSIFFNQVYYQLEDYFIPGAFIKIACETMFPIEIIGQILKDGKEVLYD